MQMPLQLWWRVSKSPQSDVGESLAELTAEVAGNM